MNRPPNPRVSVCHWVNCTSTRESGSTARAPSFTRFRDVRRKFNAFHLRSTPSQGVNWPESVRRMFNGKPKKSHAPPRTLTDSHVVCRFQELLLVSEPLDSSPISPSLSRVPSKRSTLYMRRPGGILLGRTVSQRARTLLSISSS